MQRAILRHSTAYTLTALLYLGLIALFYTYQKHKNIHRDILKQKHVYTIEMSLSSFVPKVVATPKPILTKVIEKKIINKVKPLPKPIIKKKEKLIKKPIKKVKVKKKVVKKKRSKPKGKVSHKTKKKEHRKQRLKASSKEKKNFLEKIRKKIEENKHYPRIARKRGLEGKVIVRFKILANGKVSNIFVSGSKLFYGATKEAVEDAFPINIKNMPISLLNDYVSIPLAYRIR